MWIGIPAVLPTCTIFSSSGSLLRRKVCSGIVWSRLQPFHAGLMQLPAGRAPSHIIPEPRDKPCAQAMQRLRTTQPRAGASPATTSAFSSAPWPGVSRKGRLGQLREGATATPPPLQRLAQPRKTCRSMPHCIAGCRAHPCRAGRTRRSHYHPGLMEDGSGRRTSAQAAT
jgi:hypothetical protein